MVRLWVEGDRIMIDWYNDSVRIRSCNDMTKYVHVTLWL